MIARRLRERLAQALGDQPSEIIAPAILPQWPYVFTVWACDVVRLKIVDWLRGGPHGP